METTSLWFSSIIVALGAIPGAIARFLTVTLLNRILSSPLLPWGTLTVNLVGALVMGFAITWFSQYQKGTANWQLWLLVGFLGSFTTFSSYALETWRLLNGDRPWLGWIYGLGSVALGLAAVQIGTALAKSWTT
ncbi:MAG: fluoride efflux transporter CrcB [Cyanobacteria bacterium P01_D01_bin.73]